MNSCLNINERKNRKLHGCPSKMVKIIKAKDMLVSYLLEFSSFLLNKINDFRSENTIQTSINVVIKAVMLEPLPSKNCTCLTVNIKVKFFLYLSVALRSRSNKSWHIVTQIISS